MIRNAAWGMPSLHMQTTGMSDRDRHGNEQFESTAHLVIEGEVTPDHELSAHNVQDDGAHAPGLLRGLLQIPQRLPVVVHRAPLHTVLRLQASACSLHNASTAKLHAPEERGYASLTIVLLLHCVVWCMGADHLSLETG